MPYPPHYGAHRSSTITVPPSASHPSRRRPRHETPHPRSRCAGAARVKGHIPIPSPCFFSRSALPSPPSSATSPRQRVSIDRLYTQYPPAFGVPYVTFSSPPSFVPGVIPSISTLRRSCRLPIGHIPSTLLPPSPRASRAEPELAPYTLPPSRYSPCWPPTPARYHPLVVLPFLSLLDTLPASASSSPALPSPPFRRTAPLAFAVPLHAGHRLGRDTPLAIPRSFLGLGLNSSTESAPLHRLPRSSIVPLPPPWRPRRPIDLLFVFLFPRLYYHHLVLYRLSPPPPVSMPSSVSTSSGYLSLLYR
ncbi:hypothetical protein B0H19DRAFT_692759 [Mycena capillaripes]|nr:hypothetical protein B0H19DRAFT_692759 [Mycena capillaripes]